MSLELILQIEEKPEAVGIALLGNGPRLLL